MINMEIIIAILSFIIATFVIGAVYLIKFINTLNDVVLNLTQRLAFEEGTVRVLNVDLRKTIKEYELIIEHQDKLLGTTIMNLEADKIELKNNYKKLQDIFNNKNEAKTNN